VVRVAGVLRRSREAHGRRSHVLPCGCRRPGGALCLLGWS
jgi:hypothetical protein